MPSAETPHHVFIDLIETDAPWRSRQREPLCNCNRVTGSLVVSILLLLIGVTFVFVSYNDSLVCTCGNNSMQQAGVALVTAVTTFWLAKGALAPETRPSAEP